MKEEKSLMEDIMYFTPEVTDLRVGYECEANVTVFKTKDAWRQCTLKGVGQEVIEYHRQGVYRTPYLTKEQIKSEGWEYSGNYADLPELGFFKETNLYNTVLQYLLYYTPDTNQLRIERIVDCGTGKEDYLYNGKCRDINTLRQIQKLLEI